MSYPTRRPWAGDDPLVFANGFAEMGRPPPHSLHEGGRGWAEKATSSRDSCRHDESLMSMRTRVCYTTCAIDVRGNAEKG